MKKCFTLLLIFILFVSSGCGDQQNLEDVEPALILGIDLNDQEELTFYTSAPIFPAGPAGQAEQSSQSKKFRYDSTKAPSFFQAKKLLNAKTSRLIGGRKLQILMIGRKLLSKRDIYPYLDRLFRDPKIEIHAKLVAVDGKIPDIYKTKTVVQNRPALAITKMIEEANSGESTVDSPLFIFRRQHFNQFQTPSLTELGIEKDDIIVKGTCLLSDKGTRTLSLNQQESSLLLILQNELEAPVFLSTQSNAKQEKKKIINVEIRNLKKDVKVNYQKDRFLIDIHFKLLGDLAEHVFPEGTSKTEEKKLEAELKKTIEQDLLHLLLKLQKDHVYPVDFGKHAQLQQYDQWKKHKKDWLKALNKAEFKTSVEIKIQDKGTTKE